MDALPLSLINQPTCGERGKNLDKRSISKVHLLPFNLKQTNPFCKLENREADNYLNVLWVFDAYMKNSNHAIPVRMKTPECHAKQFSCKYYYFFQSVQIVKFSLRRQLNQNDE